MASKFTGFRPDLSQSLIHLTKPWPNPPVPAFDVLTNICREGLLRGGTGYIKGGQPAVCFTEAPLSSIRYMVESATNENRYSYYGIAISKQTGFRAGARPVIYLPDRSGGCRP